MRRVGMRLLGSGEAERQCVSDHSVGRWHRSGRPRSHSLDRKIHNRFSWRAICLFSAAARHVLYFYFFVSLIEGDNSILP